MDLSLYFRVLWRFRLIVLTGVALGSALAILSVYKVELGSGKPTFTSRSHDVWLSAATLFVTQEGFPWGRSILDETVPLPGTDGEESVPRFGDPGRYSGLAALYVELAKSDPVHRVVLNGAPPDVRYEPDVVKSSDGGSILPMMYMKGFAPTPEAAQAIANRAAVAFRAYLAAEQARSKIPVAKRVEVTVTSRATTAVLFEPRSLVRPIFLFLLVLMGSVAVAFVLENLRPSEQRPPLEVRTVSSRLAEPAPKSAQRSA
jgi:hypothetical protein